MNKVKYQAAFLMGLRDAKAHSPAYSDRNWTKEQREGYSDGYHKGQGSPMTW